jgi:hypothetical protein
MRKKLLDKYPCEAGRTSELTRIHTPLLEESPGAGPRDSSWSSSEVIDDWTQGGRYCGPLGAKCDCTIGLKLKVKFAVAASAQPAVL